MCILKKAIVLLDPNYEPADRPVKKRKSEAKIMVNNK